MWGISFRSVSSVQFGEEARGWGVAEETDMRLSLEITIDRHDLCACLYVYMCVRVDIMHVSKFFCIYIHTLSLTHTSTNTHTHLYKCIYIACQFVYERAYICSYVRIHVCMFLCKHVFMYGMCVCVCARARVHNVAHYALSLTRDVPT